MPDDIIIDGNTGLNLNGDDVSSETFPLPGLSEKLSRIRTDVYQGRGFATIRGLDVDALGSADLMIAYLGLTSHVSKNRGKQNNSGGMLGDYVPLSHPAGPR